MGGMQRMVRAEVFRGKFRNSFSKPVPFIPGKISEVKYMLNDVLHTFKKGHRIMIQVQSSWFPLVDRNPQKFMRIPEANESDYQKATIRIYHDVANPSSISLPVLR
jgi:predicted acyl esterase